MSSYSFKRRLLPHSSLYPHDMLPEVTVHVVGKYWIARGAICNRRTSIEVRCKNIEQIIKRILR